MLDRKEAIKVLRNNGAKLDENDNYGMTPFLSAVDNGHQASATLLLRLGADPNTRDKRQRSCIHVAVENEDTTMLAALLQETGPELLDGRDKRGRTPIHYAALSRKLEVTLESPCTVNVPFSEGEVIRISNDFAKFVAQAMLHCKSVRTVARITKYLATLSRKRIRCCKLCPCCSILSSDWSVRCKREH